MQILNIIIIIPLGCPTKFLQFLLPPCHRKILRQVIDNVLLIWKQDITDLIKAGIKIKEFRTDRKPIDLAWLLISLVEGAVSVYNVTQNAAITANLLDNAEQVFQSYFTIII